MRFYIDMDEEMPQSIDFLVLGWDEDNHYDFFDDEIIEFQATLGEEMVWNAEYHHICRQIQSGMVRVKVLKNYTKRKHSPCPLMPSMQEMIRFFVTDELREIWLTLSLGEECDDPDMDRSHVEKFYAKYTAKQEEDGSLTFLLGDRATENKE